MKWAIGLLWLQPHPYGVRADQRLPHPHVRRPVGSRCSQSGEQL